MGTLSYEAVIGLEIHAQLLTKTKLFCSCSTDFGAPPNQNVCPVCLALPGALPVLNGEAVRLATRAALALGLSLNERSAFARKNYFYPDLPKGYQISQFDEPYSSSGVLDYEVEGQKKRAGITRIHMEEDAGKNVHGVGGDSAVDLNRAGTPLIEIVGEPDLRSGLEAVQYMRAIREILLFLGVNDGNLEEGSFRCDVNVSIRPHGESRLGTRVELKNINSFRFVQKAIEVELARQHAILEDGGKIFQETRGYDAEANRTYSLRSKEDAHDYRYFPDPDLPQVVLSAEMIERERSALPELPAQVRGRYLAEGLTELQAGTLTQHPRVVEFVELVHSVANEILSKVASEIPFKKVANFVLTEVLRAASFKGQRAEFSVSAEHVGELLVLVERGRISGKQAKEVFSEMERTQAAPLEIVQGRGLSVVTDGGAIESLLRQLWADNPKQAQGLKEGRKQLAGFFVGQVMKATQGSADPALVNELLDKLVAE
jgi:aspartyl-tRNA(Asn)/glutamyl-tRNA(Gln) amidotransferase subunit B